jgi:hypothetical protein
MPWEVSIKKPDKPLGSREEVISLMTAAVPTIQWIVEPPLTDRIKDTPNHPFHKLLPTWDESTRTHMSTSHLHGIFSDGRVHIRFFGFEQTEPMTWINSEIRGNGNPIPVLAAICIPNGWIAVDFCENKQIDLASADSSSWDAFRQYRDDAIQRIRERRESKPTDEER